MRIVVTGGGGLLGSHLLTLLGGDDVQAPGREFDLEQRPDWDSLGERVDAIVYLAQSPHFRLFPERAADVFAVNSGEVLRALDYARRAGAKRFVYASTGGVYRPSAEPL
ncbi:NAD-dependent epimerase/dehydratase family protein, partial [Allosphingosinicella sp.]|uniref:NAD-dependent epimerase/dehydratase family protein n=1 Tax=Allosphingosinicella sp. TaxID=2823234 RepID=UPI002F119470